jgi:hypothetical protein
MSAPVKNHLWVVESRATSPEVSDWSATDYTFVARDMARDTARLLRKEGADVRVVKYLRVEGRKGHG